MATGSDYASTATALVFKTSGELQYTPTDATEVNAGFGGLYSVAPLPFDTWEIEAPTIEDISQNGSPVTSVVSGTSFVIDGVGLYPSLVLDVLLGGVVLDATFWSPVTSDKASTVIAPSSSVVPLGIPLSVIVRTTEGFSNTNVTVKITAPK